MNRLFKVLVIATSCMIATAFQAVHAIEPQQTANVTHTMQRYTFVYDFNHTVHPVVKFIKEQQQFIEYQLVTEVQQQAYSNINEIGSGVLVAEQIGIPSTAVSYTR